MPLKLVCSAHSPLIRFRAPGDEIERPVQAAFDELTREVEAFDPELIVIFGPDHFAGFLYELMPPFCIGLRARAMGDFEISSPGLSYQVPEETALRLAEHLQAAELDVAISYAMQADHGFAQSLEQIAGGVGRYPTIPIFINCAAPPLPTMARVRQLGHAVGSFLAPLSQRVLVIGSGGLSHDPPIPDIRSAAPELQQLLISGRDPKLERMPAKLRRNLAVADELVRGSGSARPLNPEWDRCFVDALLSGSLDEVAALSTAAIREAAGVGGQEVRTWLAAFAALAAAGRYEGRLRHYRAIPHWNAGFGIVSAGNLAHAGRKESEHAG